MADREDKRSVLERNLRDSLWRSEEEDERQDDRRDRDDDQDDD